MVDFFMILPREHSFVPVEACNLFSYHLQAAVSFTATVKAVSRYGDLVAGILPIPYKYCSQVECSTAFASLECLMAESTQPAMFCIFCCHVTACRRNSMLLCTGGGHLNRVIHCSQSVVRTGVAVLSIWHFPL